MMVVVRHEKEDKSYYNLYVSDVTGVKYALSLENILSDRREVWNQNMTLVDIYRVTTLYKTCYPLMQCLSLPGRCLKAS